MTKSYAGNVNGAVIVAIPPEINGSNQRLALAIFFSHSGNVSALYDNNIKKITSAVMKAMGTAQNMS